MVWFDIEYRLMPTYRKVEIDRQEGMTKINAWILTKIVIWPTAKTLKYLCSKSLVLSFIDAMICDAPLEPKCHFCSP